jgi:hypothetical protein
MDNNSAPGPRPRREKPHGGGQHPQRSGGAPHRRQRRIGQAVALRLAAEGVAVALGSTRWVTGSHEWSAAVSVVPGNPGEDRRAGLGPGAVVRPADQLHLEGGKPALGRRGLQGAHDQLDVVVGAHRVAQQVPRGQITESVRDALYVESLGATSRSRPARRRLGEGPCASAQGASRTLSVKDHGKRAGRSRRRGRIGLMIRHDPLASLSDPSEERLLPVCCPDPCTSGDGLPPISGISPCCLTGAA